MPSPSPHMQVTEEFLKQLGSRPLAAALGDLEKLLAAAAAAAQGSTDGTPATAAASLAAGIALQPEATDSLAGLGQLLSEIQVADAVMKLDLGPDVTKTLDMLSGVFLGGCDGVCLSGFWGGAAMRFCAQFGSCVRRATPILLIVLAGCSWRALPGQGPKKLAGSDRQNASELVAAVAAWRGVLSAFACADTVAAAAAAAPQTTCRGLMSVLLPLMPAQPHHPPPPLRSKRRWRQAAGESCCSLWPSI